MAEIEDDNQEVPIQNLDDDIPEEVEVEDKRKRKKRAWCWDELEVKIVNGVNKAICKHCKKSLTINPTGVTTHLARHLDNCMKRRLYLKSQQKLNFLPKKDGLDGNFVRPLLFDMKGKYDHSKMRKGVSHFVLMGEHAFNIVEEVGFNFMMKLSNPSYERITRKAIKKESVDVYEEEKIKLKLMLKNVNRISITTDMWNSRPQKIEYMVITAHFIDSNWKLQKRVLSFVHVPPPRRGVDIADAILKCLVDWDIENKVHSVTVDNATYNDTCLRKLKSIFSRTRKLIAGGELFQVRCCAHIVNLLVQDGLHVIEGIIDDVRESVKYVNHSEQRLQTFANIVQHLQLHGRKLVIDCPTRWNSTYEMLFLALQLKEAFTEYKERENQYTCCLSEESWEKVSLICEVLQVFNSVTHIVSGSDYPTANLYLAEVYNIKKLFDDKMFSENDFIRQMISEMKKKFDKYWGEVNLLMVIASVLDPRCKMKLVEFAFNQIYGAEEVQRNIKKARDVLYSLYDEYVTSMDAGSSDQSPSATPHSNSGGNNLYNQSETSGWRKYQEEVRRTQNTPALKSDIDVYLEEDVYIFEGEGTSWFDVLE